MFLLAVARLTWTAGRPVVPRDPLRCFAAELAVVPRDPLRCFAAELAVVPRDPLRCCAAELAVPLLKPAAKTPTFCRPARSSVCSAGVDADTREFRGPRADDSCRPADLAATFPCPCRHKCTSSPGGCQWVSC